MFEISARFQKCSEKWRKGFCCWDNCIWIGIVKLSLLRTGYFSWTANVLTRSIKILHVRKWDFFQRDSFGNDQWIWWDCCGVDFNCAWVRFPCCLLKGPLKRGILDIYLTTFFRVRKFQNTKGMRVNFFSKNV